jgi:hypothetical protein
MTNAERVPGFTAEAGAGAQRGGYVARASIDGLGASRVTPAALPARPPSVPTPSKARSRFA